MRMINYLEAAEVINQAYDVRSTYDMNRKYDFFFVFDDDITAVLRSMHIYKYVKERNPNCQLVMVGGEGLLETAFKVMRFSLKVRCKANNSLQKETEAQRLKRVAIAMGVPKEDIMLADKGRNTTENLRAMSNIAQGKKSLVVSTQRLAMVFQLSADYQCNTYPEKFGCKHFDYDLKVVHQSVEDTLHWYNFQRAAGARVALHFYASLVRRFEVYNGKFLIKPFEPGDDVKKADALLRNKFLIKQRHTGLKLLRAYLQYVPIIWSVFWHAEDYQKDERLAIKEANQMYRS